MNSERSLTLQISAEHIKEALVPMLTTLGYFNNKDEYTVSSLGGLQGVIPVEIKLKEVLANSKT